MEKVQKHNRTAHEMLENIKNLNPKEKYKL